MERPLLADGEDSMTGALGLSQSEASEIAQAVAACLVDRGFDKGEIIDRLKQWSLTYREEAWLELYCDPAIDNLAYSLGFESAWPEDEA